MGFSQLLQGASLLELRENKKRDVLGEHYILEGFQPIYGTPNELGSEGTNPGPTSYSSCTGTSRYGWCPGKANNISYGRDDDPMANKTQINNFNNLMVKRGSTLTNYLTQLNNYVDGADSQDGWNGKTIRVVPETVGEPLGLFTCPVTPPHMWGSLNDTQQRAKCEAYGQCFLWEKAATGNDCWPVATTDEQVWHGINYYAGLTPAHAALKAEWIRANNIAKAAGKVEPYPLNRYIPGPNSYLNVPKSCPPGGCICPDVCPSSTVGTEIACKSFGDCCTWKQESAGNDWCSGYGPPAPQPATGPVGDNSPAFSTLCGTDSDCKGHGMGGHCVRAYRCERTPGITHYTN